MAKNTAVRLLDDLNGEPAQETIRFSLDGADYDIDLSAENARSLRDILDMYVEHGRRTGGRKRAARVIEPSKPAVRKKAISRRTAAGKAAPATVTATKTAAAKTGVKRVPKPAAKKSAGQKAVAKRTVVTKASEKKAASSTKVTSKAAPKTIAAAAKNATGPKAPRKAPAVKFSSAL